MKNLFIALLLIAFSSCSVTKNKALHKSQVDSTVNAEIIQHTVSSESSDIDTSFHTEPDTLSGYAEPNNDEPVIIESDEQTIIVSKPKGKSGVHVKAIKKPEKITVQFHQQKQQVTTTNQKMQATVHRKEKDVQKDKQTSWPWWVYAIVILFITVVVWYIYYRIKAVRTATKIATGK